MALTVTTAFDNFLANISLTGDHAETAKARTEKIIELLTRRGLRPGEIYCQSGRVA